MLTLTATIKRLGYLSTKEEQQVYKKVFFEFYSPLVRFANMIISERKDAANIVSDVFVLIWKDRNKLLLLPGLKIFLYKETKKLSFNYLQQKDAQFNIDELPVEWVFLSRLSEKTSITTEVLERINQTVSGLSLLQKLILKLFVEDKFTINEAASVMDIPPYAAENHFIAIIKKIGEQTNIKSGT